MGVVSSMFLLDATAANLFWLYFLRKFEQKPSRGRCRRFFFASLVHLLAIITFFSVHATGPDGAEPLWRREMRVWLAKTLCMHEMENVKVLDRIFGRKKMDDEKEGTGGSGCVFSKLTKGPSPTGEEW